MHADLRARLQEMLDGAAEPVTGAVVAMHDVGGDTVAALSRASATSPFTTDGIFALYSFTKTLIAAALLRLEADRRIDLDATLERWWPDLPSARQITLRQTLAHRSGLPSYGSLPAYAAAIRDGDTPWSDAELLARTHAEMLVSQPGTVFNYSNIGYMLLRDVLCQVTGSDLGGALDRLIFGPLAATAASVPTTRADLARLQLAPIRFEPDASPIATATYYHPGWVAHGLAAAPAIDAARLLAGIFERLLPRPSLDAMCTPVSRMTETWPSRPWRRAAYGLGLMMDIDPIGGSVYGHTGEGPGSKVAVYRFTSAEPARTVCVITDGPNADLAERLAWHAGRAASRSQIKRRRMSLR